jgi:hypothetical protein
MLDFHFQGEKIFKNAHLRLKHFGREYEKEKNIYDVEKHLKRASNKNPWKFHLTPSCLPSLPVGSS